MHEIEISIFCEQVISVYCLFSIFCILPWMERKRSEFCCSSLAGIIDLSSPGLIWCRDIALHCH